MSVMLKAGQGNRLSLSPPPPVRSFLHLRQENELSSFRSLHSPLLNASSPSACAVAILLWPGTMRARRVLRRLVLLAVLLPQWLLLGLVCPVPPNITSGFHNGSGTYDQGTVITYNCSQNLSLIGNPSIFCSIDSNGTQWIGNPPKCKVVMCKDPVVEHGVKLNGFGTHTYRSNVTFECKIGYFMIGSYFIQCDENSTWNPEEPSCKKIAPDICGAPLIPTGSVHPLKPEYSIGTAVQVFCIPQYSFPDETIEMTTVCDGYNLWDPRVQPCFLRTSPDTTVLSITHGRVTHGKKRRYEPGDNVTVECQAGYTLKGPSMIRYIGGNKWSPELPHCILRNCLPLISYA
ncbi:complement receptor type 2-like isoform X2 [Hemicordylus capensis]|uniref:complement receptor type 2-like isoform X2 n=1 Tax=Hemicordylus capensis TaxID=884348 RepID=UPI0023049E5C|nr:complement receptor type 2-like isoform X2 [Hemicordylus capensis]